MVEKSFIQTYISAGFRVFPVLSAHAEAPDAGKRPLVSSWQRTTFNPTPDFSRFEATEMGAALDADTLVIDIDIRNGGQQSFDALCTALDTDIEAQAAAVVYSGRNDGGRHLYFRKPKDIKISKKLKDYKGIDFLSQGCFVVCAGSTHAATKEPYFFSPTSRPLTELTQVPENLLNLITKREQPLSATPLAPISENAPTNVLMAIERLSTYPPAIQGENGDDQTYKAAAMCRDLGLSKETAFEVLTTHYNPRCQPPWGARELARKVRNAYNYATQTPGNATPEAQLPLLDTNPSTNEYSVLAFTDTPNQLTTIQTTQSSNSLSTPSPDWTNSLKLTAEGTIKQACYFNTCQYIRNDTKLFGLLAFNEFKNRVVLTRPAPWHYVQKREHIINNFPKYGLDWSDEDDLHLRAYLNHIDYDSPTFQISEAVNHVARYNPFHPVRDYLKSLVWDGTPRIDDWLTKYCHVDYDSYSSEVGRKTLLAAVARIMAPGTKFDHVLVLEGLEGLRKSTAIEVLAGKDFFCDTHLDINSRDTVEMLQGVWLYEIGEMAFASRSETEAFKAFVTRLVDRARLAYGRRAMSFPRQCIFIGTTNLDEYLKSETGNRRYWPVYCKEMIDIDGLSKNRDQLWAEATYKYFNQPEELHLSNEASLLISKQSVDDRRIHDEFEDDIQTWLDENNIDFIKTSDLWEQCLQRDKAAFSRMEQIRLVGILRALKWKRTVSKQDGRSVRGFKRPGSGGYDALAD